MCGCAEIGQVRIERTLVRCSWGWFCTSWSVAAKQGSFDYSRILQESSPVGRTSPGLQVGENAWCWYGGALWARHEVPAKSGGRSGRCGIWLCISGRRRWRTCGERQRRCRLRTFLRRRYFLPGRFGVGRRLTCRRRLIRSTLSHRILGREGLCMICGAMASLRNTLPRGMPQPEQCE